MKSSEQIDQLATAMAKAQGAFPPIPKDREVDFTDKKGWRHHFRYATLDAIIDAVRKPLADNGLAVVQNVTPAGVCTVIMHSSGQWLELEPVPLRIPDESNQAIGSAITYAKRYSLCAALCVVADQDDDANAADGNPASITAVQRRPLAQPKQAAPPRQQDVFDEQGNIVEQITADGEAIKPDDPYADFETWSADIVSCFDQKQLTAQQRKLIVDHVCHSAGVPDLQHLPLKLRAAFAEKLSSGKLDHLIAVAGKIKQKASA